jgi:DNA-binding transcriptional regulator YiaG
MQARNVTNTATTIEILADYISEDELCRQLNVTTRTAREWRRRHVGPPYLTVARQILHPVPGVKDWLKGRVIDPARGEK